jgi:RHS repeat-associated protein
MRAHDAPTKYVFNGSTRVARVTGSLSANDRVQRLHAFTGWNLLSLAVGATNALAQLSAAETLYRWVPQSSNYVHVAVGESLAAGTVLWLKSRTDSTLSLVGPYTEPMPVNLAAGANFVPSAGLEAWAVGAALPLTLSMWQHTPRLGWRIRFGQPLEASSQTIEVMAPGDAAFFQCTAPTILHVPDSPSRIRYYHQDHLGSSSAITGAAGDLLQETAFYPFGWHRVFETLHTDPDPYGFTQMELDQESSLDAYPARYCDAILGRFLASDKLGKGLNISEREGLLRPQKLNTYAYVLNNPLKFVDPTGQEETQQTGEVPPSQPAPSQPPPNLTLPPDYVRKPPATTTLPSAPLTPASPVVTIPPPQPDAAARAQAAWQEAHGQPSAPPRAGGSGDVISALGKVQVNGKSLQDRVSGALLEPLKADWGKATPEEKGAVVAGAVVLAGVAAPALQKQEARAMLQAIVPKVEVPIPLGKNLKLNVSVSTTKPEGGITFGGSF